MKLLITEKPSVAETIRAVLKVNNRKEGFFIGEDYIITWCIGHLIQLVYADKYDKKYAKWKYEDLPIIPDEWKYTVSEDKNKQVNIIAELMKREDVDTIVNCADAGREGELIFRLVYNYCKCKKPIKRLWISSLEEKAILEGIENIKNADEYENLYQSALCRSWSDWLVGINATRLFSVLYNQTLNVGRVQSPTLNLLVTRQNEILNFKKEPFYVVRLELDTFLVESEKTKNKEEAEKIQLLCNNKTAIVKSVIEQKKTVSTPKLYDLTTLQREANRYYGYTAQKTLEYVQSLYEKKLCTYPRTDSNYITEDMKDELSNIIDIGIGKSPLDVSDINITVNADLVVNNSKVTDHHAIIPTKTLGNTNIDNLSIEEKNILTMIIVKLFIAVNEKHIYAETNVEIECESNIFKVKGKTILQNGFKNIEDKFKKTITNKKAIDDETVKLPEMKEGDYFNGKSYIKESFTQPPKPYTEDTLLSAMENTGANEIVKDAERKGLGTPATRASILEKLIQMGFVERKNKQLIPTEKGSNLIKILPENIKSPLLIVEWENKLKEVEKGNITKEDFMENIKKLVNKLVVENTSPVYKELVLNNIMGNKGESIGSCTRCKSDVVENKKGFFCSNESCSFALWKENKFFTSKRISLTKKVAKKLLKDGQIYSNELYSEKTGKTYSAIIKLDDTGEKYVNFKMEFLNK